MVSANTRNDSCVQNTSPAFPWKHTFCVSCFQIFLGTSIAGTIFQGYFFAFHLLNIVNNNQLLKGVIQAVTMNGESTAKLFIDTDPHRPAAEETSLQGDTGLFRSIVMKSEQV